MLSLAHFCLQAEELLPTRQGECNREELLAPKYPKWVHYFAEYMFSWSGCICSHSAVLTLRVEKSWLKSAKSNAVFGEQRLSTPGNCVNGGCRQGYLLFSWIGIRSQPHRKAVAVYSTSQIKPDALYRYHFYPIRLQDLVVCISSPPIWQVPCASSVLSAPSHPIHWLNSDLLIFSSYATYIDAKVSHCTEKSDHKFRSSRV